MIAISRITRISLNRELRIENKLLNKKVDKMLVVKEKEEKEEEGPDGDMPAEEEGMLVTGEVRVKHSGEAAFSEVCSERFSIDEESIKKELPARTLVNAVLDLAAVKTGPAAVRSECSSERFLHVRLRG